MITYVGFISELRRLIAEAKEIRGATEMDADGRFRKWRNELEGVLSQIAQVGFLLPSPVRVKSRMFGHTNNETISQAKRFEWYQMEMDDTINELEFIVRSYEKHGDPLRAEKRSNPNADWPQRITLLWLYQNAPIGLWIAVITIAVAIFGAGVYVGQNEIYRKVLDIIHEPSTATPTK